MPIGAEDVPALLEFALQGAPRPDRHRPRGAARRRRHRPVPRARAARLRPDAPAARMEGSKVFAKEVMGEAGAPTGAYSKHVTAESALAALARQERYPVVVKADGLAAGKGVIIAKTPDEARAAVEDILVAKSFGGAGEVVLVEEHLVGERGLAARPLRRRDRGTARPRPGLQAHLRRRPGPEHRRHGQLLPRPRLRAARHRRRDGPGRRARARHAQEARHHLPRGPLRGPDRHRRRHQGPRVQLPLRRPRDAGRAAAPAPATCSSSAWPRRRASCRARGRHGRRRTA